MRQFTSTSKTVEIAVDQEDVESIHVKNVVEFAYVKNVTGVLWRLFMGRMWRLLRRWGLWQVLHWRMQRLSLKKYII